MELILKRSQDKGMLGGIKFVLEAKVILTTEEKELVKKYKANKYILFDSEQKNYLNGLVTMGPITYTIADLIIGTKDKVKEISVLLEKEEVLITACNNLKVLLDIMKSFGGEKRISFTSNEVNSSLKEKTINKTDC